MSSQIISLSGVTAVHARADKQAKESAVSSLGPTVTLRREPEGVRAEPKIALTLGYHTFLH